MNAPVKRYVVFGYDDYYPGGGWGDLQGSFDTLEEAKKLLELDKPVGERRLHFDNWRIIDLQTGEDVAP